LEACTLRGFGLMAGGVDFDKKRMYVPELGLR
jgi:hypothetical protein